MIYNKKTMKLISLYGHKNKLSLYVAPIAWRDTSLYIIYDQLGFLVLGG